MKRTVDTAKVVREQALPVGGPLTDTLYTHTERQTKKASRRLADQVIANLLRSPQVVTLSGPLANIRREAERERLRTRRNTELRSLRSRHQQAVSTGDARRAERLAEEVRARAEEYAELERNLAAMFGGGSR